MKNIDDITPYIQDLKHDLENLYGINKLAIFGSFAQGKQNSNSDLDIVILEMKKKNGFLIAKAKRFLSEKLDIEVDLGLYDSMHPFIKKRIEKDMIYV